MNYYEADIIKLQRKIKELQENPGQRLRSYQVLLQKTIELRREQLEALRQGQEQKPLADIQPLAPCFFLSMGFTNYDRGHAAVQEDGGLSGEMSIQAYKEKARNVLGLPVDTACEATYLLAGNVAAGTMPMEQLVMCTNFQCPMMAQQKLAMVHKWPHDIFHFDIPVEETEAGLEYVVNQLREFIEVAEKRFPGVIKYDEDKLIELQAREKATASLNREIYEMTKHVPSPIAGQDVVDSSSANWEYRDPEYLRARRDEIAERIEKGIAAVPGEKLRVLWVQSKIRFFNPFKVLAKRQAAVIFWFSTLSTQGYTVPVPRPAYYGGRKLTPLEEVARQILARMKGGTAAHFVDNLLMVCRDLKIDAIIALHPIGATCYLGWKRLISERAEKELGIPTLHLEGNRIDPSYVDEATMTAKLDEFAQMCLSMKGLA